MRVNACPRLLIVCWFCCLFCCLLLLVMLPLLLSSLFLTTAVGVSLLHCVCCACRCRATICGGGLGEARRNPPLDRMMSIAAAAAVAFATSVVYNSSCCYCEVDDRFLTKLSVHLQVPGIVFLL